MKKQMLFILIAAVILLQVSFVQAGYCSISVFDQRANLYVAAGWIYDADHDVYTTKSGYSITNKSFKSNGDGTHTLKFKVKKNGAYVGYLVGSYKLSC